MFGFLCFFLLGQKRLKVCIRYGSCVYLCSLFFSGQKRKESKRTCKRIRNLSNIRRGNRAAIRVAILPHSVTDAKGKARAPTGDRPITPRFRPSPDTSEIGRREGSGAPQRGPDVGTCERFLKNLSRIRAQSSLNGIPKTFQTVRRKQAKA